MKIVIAGAGEVGLHLSKLLSYESHDITLIDNDEVNLKDGENYLDIKVVNGDSTSLSSLNNANVSMTIPFSSMVFFNNCSSKRSFSKICVF